MKVAIGCLVQWYEIDMLEEYTDSVKKAIGGHYKEDVIIDLRLVINQDLEKCEKKEKLYEITSQYYDIVETLQRDGLRVHSKVTYNLYTIADYRREFNTKYCQEADVLVWGETDMLLPSMAFPAIRASFEAAGPKWIATFATCRMWDDSWSCLEHVDFVSLPRDPNAWYGTRCYMNYNEMEEVNTGVDKVDLQLVYPYKFNGCGLVIASEVIKSGVNIPQAVFFTHEDTAFMNMMNIVFRDKDVPQYVFKNLLLVHNREHPQKRSYVKGEKGADLTERRKSNKWYTLASGYSQHNAHYFNKQGKLFNWNDVWTAQ